MITIHLATFPLLHVRSSFINNSDAHDPSSKLHGNISLMLDQIQLESRLPTIDSSFIVGPEPLPKSYRYSVNDRR
jgi:hypothetical protein